MDEAVTIMVPGLHRDDALAALCPDVRWLWPGLPDRPAGSYMDIGGPFSPAQAAACLRDVNDLAAQGLSREALRSIYTMHRPSGPHTSREEDAARQHFARTGEHIPAAASTPPVQDMEARRREAQSVLLMAWGQEARVLEIRQLAERYERSAQQLHTLLHSADSAADERALDDATQGTDDVPTPVAAASMLAHTDALLPAWPLVLRYAALFFPASATLCTADPGMIAALCEQGLCEASTVPCPQALRAVAERVCGGRWPLWRVIGFSGPQAACPWLDNVRDVLIINPYDVTSGATAMLCADVHSR